MVTKLLFMTISGKPSSPLRKLRKLRERTSCAGATSERPATQTSPGPGGSTSLPTVGPSSSRTLATTAFGLFVAIPAVWLYNYFQNKIERFQVEMSNASSELVDYFIKNKSRPATAAGR